MGLGWARTSGLYQGCSRAVAGPYQGCGKAVAGPWQCLGRAVALWAASGSFTERTLGVGRRQCRSERAHTSENERESVRLAAA